MLIGEFKNNVGAKNRVALPKKLRDSLQGDLYLSRGMERSLILLDEPHFSKLLEETTKFDFFSKQRRDYSRYFLGGSQLIEPDDQGRFVLPEALKEFAGITETVSFVGSYDWIELWDSKIWANKLKKLKNTYGE